ncbi:hypothetical protein [Streptococcus suis]|nr:hypothetical protein [Streptococcus suis]
MKENKKREHTPPTAEAFNVGGSNSRYLNYNSLFIFLQEKQEET